MLPLRPMIGAALRKAYFDPSLVTDADVDAYALPLATAGGLRAFVARGNRDDTFDRSALVAGIKAPTLVVLGEVDLVSPLSIGRAYHATIAGSRLPPISPAESAPNDEATSTKVCIPVTSSDRGLQQIGIGCTSLQHPPVLLSGIPDPRTNQLCTAPSG